VGFVPTLGTEFDRAGVRVTGELVHLYVQPTVGVGTMPRVPFAYVIRSEFPFLVQADTSVLITSTVTTV
jgi:hypothetical protein